jgi:hypothetical protein
MLSSIVLTLSYLFLSTIYKTVSSDLMLNQDLLFLRFYEFVEDIEFDNWLVLWAWVLGSVIYRIAV